MKRFLLIVISTILFLFVFPLQTFASNWNTYKYNSQNNPVVFDSAQNKPTPNYSLSYTDVPTPYGYPVSANGVLYYSKNFGDSQVSELYAVSISDGSLIWKNNYSRPIYNLSLYDSKLYFGADNIYCLNIDDGSELWVARVGLVQNPIYNPYVYMVYQDVVLAQESYSNFTNKSFLALDTNNGQIITNMNRYNMTQTSGIIADGQTFYISHRNNYGGRIDAFNISTFAQVWLGDLCLNGDQPTIDSEHNRIYLLGSTRICVIDSTNGKKLFNENYHLDYGLVKYGDRMSGFYGGGTGSFATGDDRAVMSYGSVFSYPEKFVSSPLIVNDTMYGGSNKGRIWSVNLETGEEKITTIGDPDDFVYHLIYTSGKIVAITKNDRVGANLRVLDKNNVSVLAHNYTVTLENPYTIDGNNSYLGQIHCHYIPDVKFWNKIWNGIPSPGFTINAYKDLNYSFVALTEHNEIVQMPILPESSIFQIQNAMESTQFWGKHHILAIGINSNINNDADDQSRIDAINNQGGIPIFAHPDSWVYGALSETINKLTGINHLEAYNNAVKNSVIPDAYAFDDFDYLATKGNHKYLTAGDDYTPGNGFIDGAAVIVFASDNSQIEIMNSLKNGNFYALEGSKAPRIQNITAQNGVITIFANEMSDITFIGKDGDKLETIKDVLSASYAPKGDEIYVRAEIKSKQTGKYAWTQPIYVSLQTTRETSTSGYHVISIGQASLKSIATSQVTANILDQSQYPSAMPPGEYLSPIYQFNTASEIRAGTELAINYANVNLPTNQDNLTIYWFNEAHNLWQEVPSNIDLENKVVSANLNHFSNYTLGAKNVTDTEKPTLELTAPTDLSNLSGEVQFQVTASDNEAVTKVKFTLDSKYISSDINGLDGWSAKIDLLQEINGAHKLNISAEDYSGNITEKSYGINMVNGISVPSIDIITPVNNDNLFEPSQIFGNFSSQIDVENIGIYLNDVFITNAEINQANKSFTKLVNWSEFKEGNHKLKILLNDKNNNRVSAEVDVNIDQAATAQILSPEAQSYLRGQKTSLNVLVVPESADIKVLFDGTEVGNNSVLDLIKYKIGEHEISVVDKDNKQLALLKFSIITNYSDTRNIVAKLYTKNHITNFGIAASIVTRLCVTKLLDQFGLEKPKKIILDGLKSFIFQQSLGKKSKIDNFGSKILIENIEFLKK